MLKNEYLVAKIGFDTAENEPCKVCRIAGALPLRGPARLAVGDGARAELRAPMLGLTKLSNYLTLKGSFSAVSKPNFASKYALESSRRDLQHALLCTVLVESVL